MWAKRRQRLTAATIANARAIRASVRLDQLVGSLIQVTDTILQGLWCSSWQEGGVHRLSGAAHHFGDDVPAGVEGNRDLTVTADLHDHPRPAATGGDSLSP
jgi:hypothetical protein